MNNDLHLLEAKELGRQIGLLPERIMTINKAGYFFVCLIWLIRDLLIPFLAINEFSLAIQYTQRTPLGTIILPYFFCFTLFLREMSFSHHSSSFYLIF